MPDPTPKPKRAVFQMRLSERDRRDLATIIDFHNQDGAGVVRMLMSAEARRIRAGAITIEPKPKVAAKKIRDSEV